MASALLHCAGAEELDFDFVQEAGPRKTTSKTGSGGSLAAGGAAGTVVSSGDSGAGGSSMDDASSAGGQGGGAGGPSDSGPADMGMAAYDVPPCTTCALSVQYSLQRADTMTNEIGFNLMIKNTGSKVVPINQIAVRYWYTINGEAAQENAIDYSNPGGATFQFVKVMPARTNADYYGEMKLTASGDLAMGQTAELHIRIHKAGYQGTYDQSDDYSYGAGHTALGDWPKITAYVGGNATPVWGTEP